MPGSKSVRLGELVRLESVELLGELLHVRQGDVLVPAAGEVLVIPRRADHHVVLAPPNIAHTEIPRLPTLIGEETVHVKVIGLADGNFSDSFVLEELGELTLEQTVPFKVFWSPST